MRVTFSDGSTRKHVVTAARAPGVKSAGKGDSRRTERAEESGDIKAEVKPFIFFRLPEFGQGE
jgi:hypothetical protein